MKNLLPTLALSIPAAALMAAFAPGVHYAIQEPASSIRWEVMPSTPLQVAAPPSVADAPTSDATAEAHDAVEPEAVSFEQPEPSVTFNCPTCKGTGIYGGALCPTCDGASAATLTKDGVTFSERAFKPAPPSPPVPAMPDPTPTSSLGPSHPPSLGQYPPRLMQCGPSGCALELARASSKPYQFARRRVFGGGFFRRRR